MLKYFKSNKRLIEEFVKHIKKENGLIVERSQHEIVSKLLSKNDAIRVGIELISLRNE